MNINLAVKHRRLERAADSNLDRQITAATKIRIQRLDDAQIHSPVRVHVHFILVKELNCSPRGHVSSFADQAQAVKSEQPVGYHEVNGTVVARLDVLNIG